MEPFLLAFYLFLVGLAALHIFLTGMQMWEHRRFARSRRSQAPLAQPEGRAMVFVPCKGVDLSMEENFRALFCQDYDDYELTFIVEDESDPAVELIRSLMAEYSSVRSRIVMAGRAETCGQKVHNLRVATARIPEGIEFLVFMDTDARPRPEWLRALLGRLGDASQLDLGAVTGYRWMIPARPSLANWFISAINAAVAGMLGSRDIYPIWGGAWAIRRSVFEQTRIRDEWDRTLSDDMVARNVLRRHGRGVRFEPTCVVTTPLDVGFWEALSFLRRQYMIGRFYVPKVWAIGVILSVYPTLVWWASLGLAIWGWIAGTALFWIPTAACVVLYLLGMVRSQIRQSLTRIYAPDQWKSLRGARWFDILGGPLVGAFNVLGLVASAFGSGFRWRSIRYRLEKGGTIEILERTEEPVSQRAALDYELGWPDEDETDFSRGFSESTNACRPETIEATP